MTSDSSQKNDNKIEINTYFYSSINVTFILTVAEKRVFPRNKKATRQSLQTSRLLRNTQVCQCRPSSRRPARAQPPIVLPHRPPRRLRSRLNHRKTVTNYEKRGFSLVFSKVFFIWLFKINIYINSFLKRLLASNTRRRL